MKTIFVSSSGLPFRGREDFSGVIRIAVGRGIETTVERVIEALSNYSDSDWIKSSGVMRIRGNLDSMVSVEAGALEEFAECAIRQELIWQIKKMPTEDLLKADWVRETYKLQDTSILRNNQLVRVALSGINSR